MRRTSFPGERLKAVVVLAYLSKEEAIQLICDAFSLLEPNGILYLSTMENDYDKSDWMGPSTDEDTKMFIYFHQEDYLTEALNEYGFQLIKLLRKTGNDPASGSTTDLIFIAQKQELCREKREKTRLWAELWRERC